MKTVTKKQAIQGFETIGDLAPWIKLVPAFQGKPGKSAAAFRARLNNISPKPIPGASEVLSRLRR